MDESIYNDLFKNSTIQFFFSIDRKTFYFNHEVKSYRRISEIHLIKKMTLSLSK